MVTVRQIDRSPLSIQLTCDSKVFRSMRGTRMIRIGQMCHVVASDPGIVSLPATACGDRLATYPVRTLSVLQRIRDTERRRYD